MVWEKDDTHVNVTLLNNETFDWFYSKEDAGSLEEGNGTIDQILPKLEKILYEYRS